MLEARTEVKHFMTPEMMAQALYEADPTQFAAVWREFSDLVEKRKGRHPNVIDDLAKAMAQEYSGFDAPDEAKVPFFKLARLASMYREAFQRNWVRE